MRHDAERKSRTRWDMCLGNSDATVRVYATLRVRVRVRVRAKVRVRVGARTRARAGMKGCASTLSARRALRGGEDHVM